MAKKQETIFDLIAKSLKIKKKKSSKKKKEEKEEVEVLSLDELNK